MRTFTTFLISLLLIFSTADAQQIVRRAYDATKPIGFVSNQYESWTYNKSVTGHKLPFRMLKPRNWDSVTVEKYPLIIFFHGKGEAGSDNNYHLIHGGKKHQDAVNMIGGRTFPGFVLFPQTSLTIWSDGVRPTFHLDMAFELIDSMLIKYNINPNNVYVHGLSGGGLGTWMSLLARPQLFAAGLPMSAPFSHNNAAYISPIPIWLSQGGIDPNPVPFIARKMMAALRTAGAVDSTLTKYTEYANQGHNIWNNTYDNPDFFPYMLRQDKRNIMLMGKNNICPGEKISLAVSPGFVDYMWFFNNTTVAGVVSNRINNISIAGLYAAAFKRTLTSPWVYTNTVQINTGLASAKPTITGDNSFYLPSPQGNTVALSGPQNQIAYRWSSGATTQKINVNVAGNYTLRNTPQTGCPSLPSDVVSVRVGPNGPNAPLAATALSAYPISNRGIIVQWKDNSNNEAYFEVYTSAQRVGPYTFVGFTAINATSYIVNNLAPTTTYFYKVRAVNADGGNLSITETRARTMGDFVVPTSPSSLRFTAFTPQLMQLTWNAAFDLSGIKKYMVYNRDTLLGETDSIAFNISLTNGALKRGSINNFNVVAVDNGGNRSAPSNELAFANNGLGLFANYYEGTYSSLPNFASVTPLKTGLVRNATVRNNVPLIINTLTGLDFPSKGTNFALKLEGFIFVNTGLGYRFFTESDDGSKLWINGIQIVDNDRLQGMTERSGTYTFPTRGWHPITIGFFQAGGGLGLNTRYECSAIGLAKQTLPLNALSYFRNGTIAGVVSTPGFNTTITGAMHYPGGQVDMPRIRIQWTLAPFAGLRGFEIYRIATTVGTNVVRLNSDWQKIATIRNTTVSPNTYAYVDTTHSPGAYLIPNTRYFYALIAITNSGNTGYIGYGGTLANPTFLGIAVPSTTPGIPAMPSNLSTLGISNTVVSLNWTDNATNESGFEVWRSYTKNGIFVKAGIVPKNKTTFFDSTGEARTKYVYKIRSFNSSGVSTFTGCDSTNTLNIPTAPSNLKAMTVGPNAINVTWKNNSEYAFGYSLYRSTDRNTGYLLVTSIPNPSLAFYQDMTVISNVEYYYKVQAFNENISVFSNIDSSTTLLSAAPETDWKLPAADVKSSFDAALMNNTVNGIKLKNALVSKNDFFSNLVVTASGTSSISVKLPVLAEMERGGFMTINFIKAMGSEMNSKGDTLNNRMVSSVIDTTRWLQLDYGRLNSPFDYRITVSVSGNNTDTTTWVSLPHNINAPSFNWSNLLQRIDFPSSIAGRWVKISVESVKSTNPNLFLTEIGMYKILPVGKRHNYFLLLGASIEQQSPSQGLRAFRRRLIANGIAGGSTAVVFNVFGNSAIVGPGTNSLQFNSGINTILDSHPNAEYIMVHQGGNNINSIGNNMRPLTFPMFATKPEVGLFINSFVDIYTKILSRGKIPLISRMHFRDYRPGNEVVSNAGGNLSAVGGNLFVNAGRNQENGSLPYNLLLDSLAKVYAPQAYNNNEKRSSFNYYAAIINDQSVLGGDGIHPTFPANNPNPNVITDRLVDYWVRYPMQFIYNGSTATPITYDPGAKVDCPRFNGFITFTTTGCWVATGRPKPDNKANLLPLSDAAVRLAESTSAGKDIWNARLLVEQIGDRATRVPYVERLENLRDYRSPTAPSELTAFVVSSSALNLSWVRNSFNNTGYQIWRSSTSSGTNFKLAAVVTAAGALGYLDSGLSGDSLYTYYVKAINGSYSSSWSNLASARPSSTFYSKEMGDLANTATWGLDLDGSGANPSGFIGAGQTFVITNRGYVTSLTSNMNVSGNFSKVILSSNNQLSIESTSTLTGIIDVMDNATLSIRSAINPTLGSVDTTSTISFGNTNTIPVKDYGHIVLSGSGARNLPTGNIKVYRSITLEPGITLQGTGGNSSISLYNAGVSFVDATTSINNVSFNLISGTSSFDAMSGTFLLNNLTIGGTSILDLLNSSSLLVGANGGQNLSISSGAKLLLNNSNLSISGSATLNAGSNMPGQISVSNGSIYFSTGSTANHQLLLDATENKLLNLGINLTVGTSDTVNILSPVVINNTVKLTSGVLATNNYLTLVSNSANTARIAKVEANARLNGQITQQRYVGPFKTQSVYMLGTAVLDQTLSVWANFIALQGLSTTIDGVATILGVTNSVFKWNEPRNIWNGMTNPNAALQPGVGHRVTLRTADLTSEFNAGFYANTGIPVIGDLTGVPSNSFVFPLTKSSATRGWNVVANPYPSEIDWDSPTGWDKTNIENYYYVWDGVNRGFKVYIGITNTTTSSISSSGMSSVLNSGQGFWVYSNVIGSSNFSINESAKTELSSAPAFYRKEGSENVLRVYLHNGMGEQDEAIVRFTDESSEDYDSQIDALKLEGLSVNISTVTPSKHSLIVNSLPFKTSLSVPVAVNSIQKGLHKLAFDGIESFDKDQKVYLKDNFKNAIIDLKNVFNYSFDITDDSSSSGFQRFELQFLNNSLLDSKEKELFVYQNVPNPASTHTQIKFNLPKAGLVEFEVHNSLGQIIDKKSRNFEKGLNVFEIDFNEQSYFGLFEGVFYYSITANSSRVTKKMALIRQ